MSDRKYKIAVAGTGYVGLSLATLLSRLHEVVAVDVIQSRVDMINNRKSPIKDEYIEKFFKNKIHLTATTDGEMAYADADYVLVCVPTNYDAEKGEFDTHNIEDVVRVVLSVNKTATIVIKSTIPIGYTERLRMQYLPFLGQKPRIIFSPEFLREGSALYDNLNPSRIIVGFDESDKPLAMSASKYACLIAESSFSEGVPILTMGTNEAEAVKLFANTYLALRVAYFNELDTYAEVMGLDSKSIIKGVGADPRIGKFYNNPSFGYGGYCFPKDTKQMLANFKGIPQSTISAVVEANAVRKRFIAERIAEKASKKNGIIGVYKLAMKSGSDNFRESAVFDVMSALRAMGYKIIIHEPAIRSERFYNGYEVVNDIRRFKEESSVIVANRYESELDDVSAKVYTRDVFGNN